MGIEHINIETIARESSDRLNLCAQIINLVGCKNVAELGVFRGEFAEFILKHCPKIERYALIDPWRNLSDWNKPANKDDSTFEGYYLEALNRTKFAKEKISVLRGKTTEVIANIQDESLDFLYIDGDHTLKGITIDLISFWDKLAPDGIIVGDDFCPSIWQHDLNFEPTMIFPFAVYFAESKNAKIYGLPHNQFAICKSRKGFEFIDLADGKYAETGLRNQFVGTPGGSNGLRKALLHLFRKMRD